MKSSSVILATFLVVMGAFSVFARTVDVVSFDVSTREARLAFSAEDAGSLLYAVADAGDRGTTDVQQWKHVAYLGEVAGTATAGTYSLPEAWVANPCVIRFVLTSVHERPYDREVAYLVLNSTGTSTVGLSYIDTGIVPDATTAIEATFVQRTWAAASFGVSEQFYLFSNSGNGSDGLTYYRYGSKSGSFANFLTNLDATYTLRLGPDGAYINGDRKAGPFTEATFSTTTPLTIGARRINGDPSVAKQGFFRLYGAKVTKGGHLVRDYAPVIKDNIGYFYDRVNKTLVSPSGDGTSVFGIVDAAAVVRSDYPTDVTDWSSSVSVGRTVSVTSLDGNTGIAKVAFSGGAWSGRLFALHDTTDKGADPSSWTDVDYLARVAADATEVDVTLKSDWLNGGGIVRFVWTSDVESPYAAEMSSVSVDAGETDYVDTQIFPGLDTTVQVEAWLPDTSVDCAFGLSKVCYLFTNAQKADTFFWGFQSASGNKVTGKYWGSWHTLSVGPSGVFVDAAEIAGTETLKSATAKTPYWALVLFGRRNNETGAVEKNASRRSIKRARVWEGERLVRDYIACRKDDNKAYFYERVSGTFVGSENFRVGNDVPPTLEAAAPHALSEVAAISGLKTATWDGGAADTRMTSAANWADDVVPNLTDGTLVASFATAGTEATADTAVSLAGVALDAANDFTLGATSGGSLTLGAAGLALKSDKVLNLTAPVTIAADQCWRGVDGRTGRVNVREPLVGAAERVVSVEATTVGLYKGSPDYRGTFAFANGAIAKLFATANMFGDASVESPVSINLANGTQLDFFAATVDRPLQVTTGQKMAGSSFIIHESATTGGGRETRLTRPVVVSGGADLVLEVVGNVTNTICGGLTSNPRIVLAGAGVTRVIDHPIALSQSLILKDPQHKAILGVASNEIARIDLTGERNRLNFTVDHAACWTAQNGAPIVNVASNGVVDLKGTYQTFREISLAENSSITGEVGSFCRTIVNNDVRWKGLMTGAVTLSKGGGQTLHLDGPNTSTGDLIINNGVLQLNSNGSWAGTNIVVSAGTDTATYRFGIYNSNALNRKATLTLEGKAQLRIGNDVNVRIRRLVIDGRPVAAGTWGSSASAAQHQDDVHFADFAKGVLTVKGDGLVIVFR